LLASLSRCLASGSKNRSSSTTPSVSRAHPRSPILGSRGGGAKVCVFIARSPSAFQAAMGHTTAERLGFSMAQTRGPPSALPMMGAEGGGRKFGFSTRCHVQRPCATPPPSGWALAWRRPAAHRRHSQCWGPRGGAICFRPAMCPRRKRLGLGMATHRHPLPPAPAVARGFMAGERGWMLMTERPCSLSIRNSPWQRSCRGL
jgi:hypothetical protein